MKQRTRSQEYSRIKERLALAGSAISLAGGALYLGSGLAARVNRRLLKRSPAKATDRLRYQVVMSVASWASSLPLAWYSGYVIEKRFDLSRQTPASWAQDRVKGAVMALPLQVGLVEGMQWTIRRWPRHWWLVVSGLTIPLTSAMTFLFPVLIAPRFNRYEPLADTELAERLRDLADRSGIQVAEVMQMDMSRRTSKANAYFAGIGKTRRIVLSDTMLEQFTHDEIETVVAHEAGHQVHRDLWRMIAASSVLTLGIAGATHLVANRALSRWPELTGTTDPGEPGALPLLAFSFGVAGAVLSPLQLAFSRWIERQADAFALEMTGNGEAWASALTKLAETNLADPNPPRWVTILLHSHPPISERIDRAETASVNVSWTG